MSEIEEPEKAKSRFKSFIPLIAIAAVVVIAFTRREQEARHD